MSQFSPDAPVKSARAGNGWAELAEAAYEIRALKTETMTAPGDKIHDNLL